MTHVCHLFDASAGWEQRTAVGVLLERLPADRYSLTLAAIDPAAVRTLRPLGRPVRVFARPARIDALASPLVGRFVEERRVDLVHTWGVHAAAVARAATDGPLVVELSDPAVATREAKLLRTLMRPKGFAIICSCGIVRRRLIESGVAPELCVVIRPGIDFGWINRCRRGPLREELGVAKDDTLVIVPESVTRAGGSFEAFWAAALVNHLDGHVRAIVPGVSREQSRIVRFAATVPSRPTIITPGDRYRFEELITVCDVLIVAARGDVSSTAVAWAMTAGAAVIGAAIPSIAELIAHKVNGLLFKQFVGNGVVGPVFRLLQDRASLAKAREVARGHAYEVFGLRRCIEQHVRVYDNLMSDRAPGEGIADSARVG
jgi:glycosyltransferase involved in cell wall biosynthesis